MGAVILTDFQHDKVGLSGGLELPEPLWHLAREAIASGAEHEIHYDVLPRGCDCPKRPHEPNLPPVLEYYRSWPLPTCPHATHYLYLPKSRRGLVWKNGRAIWADVASITALAQSDAAWPMYTEG